MAEPGVCKACLMLGAPPRVDKISSSIAASSLLCMLSHNTAHSPVTLHTLTQEMMTRLRPAIIKSEVTLLVAFSLDTVFIVGEHVNEQMHSAIETPKAP